MVSFCPTPRFFPSEASSAEPASHSPHEPSATLPHEHPESEQPPVFAAWSGWYWLVAGVFVGFVAFLWWFSAAFRS